MLVNIVEVVQAHVWIVLLALSTTISGKIFHAMTIVQIAKSVHQGNILLVLAVMNVHNVCLENTSTMIAPIWMPTMHQVTAKDASAVNILQLVLQSAKCLFLDKLRVNLEANHISIARLVNIETIQGSLVLLHVEYVKVGPIVLQMARHHVYYAPQENFWMMMQLLKVCMILAQIVQFAHLVNLLVVMAIVDANHVLRGNTCLQMQIANLNQAVALAQAGSTRQISPRLPALNAQRGVLMLCLDKTHFMPVEFVVKASTKGQVVQARVIIAQLESILSMMAHTHHYTMTQGDA
jgi:hypothetical protein